MEYNVRVATVNGERFVSINDLERTLVTMEVESHEFCRDAKTDAEKTSGKTSISVLKMVRGFIAGLNR